MVKRLAMLFLLCAVGVTQAQDGLSSKREMETFLDSFLSHFIAGEYEQAFSLFRMHSNIPTNEVDSLEGTTIRQLNSLSSRYGKPLDYVFLESWDKKGVVSQYLFLLRYERHALRMRFVFYNNGRTALLNYFSWDDSIDKMFPW